MAKRSQNVERKSFENLVEIVTSKYEGKFLTVLKGPAYRFTLYLPLLCGKGKEVFSDRHRALLVRLFLKCFRGFSATTAKGSPTIEGAWKAKGSKKAIYDQHMLYTIYTPRDNQTIDFFGNLRWVLERPQVANQQEVLIELVEVDLVKPIALT